jgi:hypothetical protein
MPPDSSSPTPSASATGDAEATGDSGRRLLSAVGTSEAWRAVSGTCSASSGASLEHSTDGGTSWTQVRLGDDVGTVLALRASSSTLSVLVGVGDGCEPTVRTSTDDGVTWKAGAPGAAGAGIVEAGLVLSTGVIASPCADPENVFEGKYTTAVVCHNEVQWRSGTRAWVAVPVLGVRSIADNGDAYTVARVGIPGCDGVQIAAMPAVGVTSSTQVTAVGCDDQQADDASPVAVARAAQAVWLWSGDRVTVSTDGGAAW